MNKKEATEFFLDFQNEANEIKKRICKDWDAQLLEKALAECFVESYWQACSRDQWLSYAINKYPELEQPYHSTRVIQCFKKFVERKYLYSSRKFRKGKVTRLYGLNYERNDVES
jgi:hypothetical protein